MAKGPKVVNPVDKARKEARKKEIKKNKKQREQVRSAAIENHDPEQIIVELDKLDILEFNEDSSTTITRELFREKRKRLKEKFDRVLAYYLKEDPERHTKLKSLQQGYESRHKKLSRDYEAVLAAKEVKLSDIFLPPESDLVKEEEISDDDPLMSESIYITPFSEGIKPPGCPPGFPPHLEQIVESLKMPLTSSLSLFSQSMALNLSDRQSMRLSHRQTRQNRANSSRKLELDASKPHQRDIDMKLSPQANPSISEDRSRSALTKPKTTIIESKPVLFRSVAKFVPSSVRYKVKKPDDGLD